jgi:hypothetical protein
MHNDDVLELWKQAVHEAGLQHPHAFEEVKQFAHLIEDKVREDVLGTSTRHWSKMSQALRENEREACARMVEDMGAEDYGTLAIAAAIRNRGKK